MKKWFAVLVVLGFCSDAHAQGSVGVDMYWQTWYGGYTHDAPNITDLPSDYYLLNYYSATWQLIYAGENDEADPVDLSNSAEGWVSGDDEVWATREMPQSVGGANVTASDGTEWLADFFYFGGPNPQYTDASWTTPGYVFQRVFQGEPEELSWYYETDVTPIQINPVVPQTFYPDVPDAGFQPDMQIQTIPEPATLSLLGLGALAVAFRRRRRA